jgi:hypothetical protein
VFAPAPLTRQIVLSLYPQKDFSEGELHVVHGCYLRLEQDAQAGRIDRFKRGDICSLRRDINEEMLVVLREWKEMWKKLSTADDCYNAAMDLVHLQWKSRTIKHLQDEMYLLSTAYRSETYVASIEARKIELPPLCF